MHPERGAAEPGFKPERSGFLVVQILYLYGRLKGGRRRRRDTGRGVWLRPPRCQPDHPRYKFARQVDFCPTGYLIKKDILDQLVYFLNEQYRTFEFAHIDLAFRARGVRTSP